MFLIQTDKDGQVLFDFQHELVERIKENNWLYGSDTEQCVFTQSFANFKLIDGMFVCPVGSIEFVSDYIKKYYPDAKGSIRKPMEPINVPRTLTSFEFTKRILRKDATINEVLSILNEYPNKNFYVKSATQLKAPVRFCYKNNAASALADTKEFERFDVSEDLGMLRAEWRAFIYKGEILDVRMYVGDWKESIDGEFVQKAVNAWKLKPKACVLDFAKTDNGEFVVLEGHNFVSCGTYGFTDPNLPKMIKEGFKWEINI